MSSTTQRWLLGVLIAVLAISAIVLTFLAVDHVRTRATDSTAAPVPTFTQPARQTPSPTPTEPSTATVSYDRSQERFLTASADALWRGTAGECGAVEPSLERSADRGQTWIDVTPHYLGIGQLVALNPFANGQAEIIALMGADCETQALRTFTQGEFWESYDDVLAASQYVDPRDAASIVRSGSTIPAPCADARSLHTAELALAAVCDGSAYVLDQGTEWFALPATKAATLSVDGEEVVVAHVSEQCGGLTITRYVMTGDKQSQGATCVDVAESDGPTAITTAGEEVIVWAGDTTGSTAE